MDYTRMCGDADGGVLGLGWNFRVDWRSPCGKPQGPCHYVEEGPVTSGGPGFLTQSQVQLPWVVSLICSQPGQNGSSVRPNKACIQAEPESSERAGGITLPNPIPGQ